MPDALQQLARSDHPWIAWRAARLLDDEPGELPAIPYQDLEGGFVGTSGRVSPGATGFALCHLHLIGLAGSGAAVIAADWLEEARTPAEAWLDDPRDVPGELDTPAAGRVWATAAATCGLLVARRDPGHRALDLLRGEADQEGRFTGGAFPTFAAAGAFWRAVGPKTEMAEWALRWARENIDESWGAEEFASALVFWVVAGIPYDHASVETFADELRDVDEPLDDDLRLLVLEVLRHFG